MSTRSVIARPAGDSWEGRYAHWDGYPTCRGQELWQSYRELGSAEALVEYAIKPDSKGGSWSSYMPPSISKAQEDKPDNADKTRGWEEDDKDWWITATGPDCGTEWAYVVADKGLSIFERRFGSPSSDEGHGVGMFGLGASDTESGGYWAFLGTFAWDGDEPDWSLIETDAFAE